MRSDWTVVAVVFCPFIAKLLRRSLCYFLRFCLLAWVFALGDPTLYGMGMHVHDDHMPAKNWADDMSA
jgi:hypothetical protein